MTTQERAQGRHQVHFTVDMASIVAFARDMVLSNDWRGALRVLQTATLPAMSLDQAVDILAGKSTLQGNEAGAEVVNQDPADPAFQRYLQTAQWQKAGIYEANDEFYQPYGVISAFGAEDETRVLDQLKQWDDVVSLDEYRQHRARCYMAHKESDLVVFDLAAQPVLFKRVQGPAFWVPTFKDPQAAWQDYLAKRGRGIAQADKLDARYDPARWEFYFKGIVRGVVYDSSDATWDLLPSLDRSALEALFALRAKFDDDCYAQRTAQRGVDEDGYYVDADYLKDRFETAAYELLYRQRITEQAARIGGFMTLTVSEYDDSSYDLQVPRAPFLYWASHQNFGNRRGQLPRWTPVCPSGMKMLGDNPMHTDWWVGAGLPAKAAYNQDHPVNKAAWRYAYNLAHAEGYDCVRLAGKGKVTGPVVFPAPNAVVPAGAIAIVPNAGVDYELALLSACKEGAGAVIAEVGGKLAHLAIVSREFDARLLVVDAARQQFKEGEIVTVDLDNGKIFALGREDIY